jgi:hypothetical protein
MTGRSTRTYSRGRIHRVKSPLWPMPVASFVFSLLILLAAAIYTKDPSPFALFRSLEGPAAKTP